MSLRRTIQRSFKLHGLTVRVDAVRALESVLAREDDLDVALDTILTAIKARLDKDDSSARDGVIGEQIIKQVIAELSRNDQDMAQAAVVVVNANQMPTLRYNGTRRNFFRVPGSANVAHATAKAKTNMLRDRYVLLHQRIMRHPLFAPPMLGAQAAASGGGGEGNSTDTAPGHVELTQIESLVGSRGRRCIFGLLTERDRGEFFLEDQNSFVRLNLEHASHSAGLYTKGCFVLAEGQVCDEVFIVDVLGFPPPEPRAQTLIATGGNVDFLGLPIPTDQEHMQMRVMEQESDEAMLVVLSDVHLDNPRVMEKLRDLFEGFNSLPTKPPLFILIGNFVSKPCGTGPEQVSATQFKEYLGGLGNLIASFPELVEESHFVLVPGPDDLGAANMLPRPAFPNAITKLFYEALGEYENAHVTFASNPCRIKYYTQEIVVMRDDLIKKMRRNCVLPPLDGLEEPSDDSNGMNSDADASDDESNNSDSSDNFVSKQRKKKAAHTPPQLSEHLVKTLVDQSHLCPLPSQVQPVQWTMDPSLRLYPLPDLLILADHYEQYQCKYADCAVFNPGPFHTDFSFVVYRPSSWETEFSTVGGGEADASSGGDVSEAEQDAEEEEEEEVEEEEEEEEERSETDASVHGGDESDAGLSEAQEEEEIDNRNKDETMHVSEASERMEADGADVSESQELEPQMKRQEHSEVPMMDADE